jgi:hypothetical protein
VLQGTPLHGIAADSAHNTQQSILHVQTYHAVLLLESSSCSSSALDKLNIEHNLKLK